MLKAGYDPAYERYSFGLVLHYSMIVRGMSKEFLIYDFRGEDGSWKREWISTVQKRMPLRLCAPRLRGHRGRTVQAYDNPTLEHMVVARSVLGGRGQQLVKRRWR